MKRVILESPWAGNVRKHRNYARKCVRDCLKRDEAPIASHLLFTQPGILKDELAEERKLGIDAGLAWSEVADAAVFYADYGFSFGMQCALEKHSKLGTPVEVRYLFKRVRKPPQSKRGGASVEKSADQSASDGETGNAPTVI